MGGSGRGAGFGVAIPATVSVTIPFGLVLGRDPQRHRVAFCTTDTARRPAGLGAGRRRRD
jgi:hypothetical protein